MPLIHKEYLQNWLFKKKNNQKNGKIIKTVQITSEKIQIDNKYENILRTFLLIFQEMQIKGTHQTDNWRGDNNQSWWKCKETSTSASWLHEFLQFWREGNPLLDIKIKNRQTLCLWMYDKIVVHTVAT